MWGDTAIMFLGQYEGGALLLEDGQRLEERGVWHRYDGARLLHWNEDITAGVKYSVVAHNDRVRPLAYPYEKSKEHVAQEGEAPAGQSRQEAPGL